MPNVNHQADSANNDLLFRRIITSIERQKCILFLGPEVFAPNEDIRYVDKLKEFLPRTNNDFKFYKDDLFYFEDDATKTDISYDLHEFFEQSFETTESIFDKISQIPFHFIISVNPDEKLAHSFRQNGYIHHTKYYNWSNPAYNSIQVKPTKGAPIIYNLFGSINEAESLVLTPSDFFEYLQSFISTNEIRNNLIQIINKADNFIFLGFQFEKWYMQLLLRLLQINNNKTKYAFNELLHAEFRNNCTEQFNIKFINKGIQSFINSLHNKCNEKNIIRSQQNNVGNHNFKDVINDLIANNRIGDVLDKLNLVIERTSDLYTDYLLIKNRYSRLQQRIHRNDELTHQEIERKSNKLILLLIDLNTKLFP